MPNKPKPIKITITSGVKGQPITVRNMTTGDEIHTTLPDTAKAIVDLNDFTNGYSTGDIIDITVSGERMGNNSLTISASETQSITVSTSSITSGLSRGI